MAKSRPASVRACDVLAASLKHQGVDVVFGIVGYPMYMLAASLQAAGVKYVGCHNEQAASYAAAAVGYLTGRPGGVMVVTGPGVVHAVAGMANAKANCWPMICIGGSHERRERGRGAFQEVGAAGDCHQLDYVRPAAKYAAALDDARRIPFFVEQAVRYATLGRPGAAYLDVPADLMREFIPVGSDAARQPPRCPGPRLTQAAPADVAAAVALLRGARAPLLIIGKGAQYARCTDELRTLAEATSMPFLPTPMGKGCLPDEHPLCVAAARSAALRGADVVLLVGARLNWILHHGDEPRYAAGARFIKIDVAEEGMHDGHTADVALVGHAKAVLAQLNAAVGVGGGATPLFAVAPESAWARTLAAKVSANAQASAALAADRSVPMNYYCALTAIQAALPADAIIMSEGANTMDIGRTILRNSLPRSRLDAGTFGTMGVGMGQVMAACVVHPERKVVAVMGDSAFGFSGMEYETVVRYRFNALVIVLNNNGIAGGAAPWKEEWSADTAGALRAPPFALKPSNNYEQMAAVFGGEQYLARTPDELEAALPAALAHTGPAIMHVRIDPLAGRKKQEFEFDPTGAAAKKKVAKAAAKAQQAAKL